MHTSLDVVEEKISSVGKNTNDLRELYLGLLYPTEDYKVYPFADSMVQPQNLLKFFINQEKCHIKHSDLKNRHLGIFGIFPKCYVSSKSG